MVAILCKSSLNLTWEGLTMSLSLFEMEPDGAYDRPDLKASS